MTALRWSRGKRGTSLVLALMDHDARRAEAEGEGGAGPRKIEAPVVDVATKHQADVLRARSVERCVNGVTLGARRDAADRA
jgi:hypothetical protein